MAGFLLPPALSRPASSSVNVGDLIRLGTGMLDSSFSRCSVICCGVALSSAKS